MTGKMLEVKYKGETVKYDARFGHIPMVVEDDMSDIFADRILNAQTWDEAMELPETTGLRDLVDVNVQVLDATGRPSTLKDGPGLYVVIDLVRQDTGERLAVTSGAKNVLALLARAHKDGKFPFFARVREVVSNQDANNRSTYLVRCDNPDF